MPLSVIGAGYPRTATLSLKVALEQVGFGPCYHMTEVFANPQHWPHWIHATRGERVDWEHVFGDYQSTTDAPGCFFYEELAQRYPQAKFILSVRPSDRWYESASATVLDESNLPPGATGFENTLKQIFYDRYDGRHTDRDYMIAAYDRHNRDVVRTIPKDRLLIYEPGDSWEPVCEFLQISVPDTPFPRVNDRAQFGKVAAMAEEHAAQHDNFDE
jgi:hypothetical protein